jgi:hypothetical protein
MPFLSGEEARRMSAYMSRFPRILWGGRERFYESYADVLAAAAKGIDELKSHLAVSGKRHIANALNYACATNQAAIVRTIASLFAHSDADFVSEKSRGVCVNNALLYATGKHEPGDRAEATRALLETIPWELFTEEELHHALLDACSCGHVKTLRVLADHGIGARLLPSDRDLAEARLPIPDSADMLAVLETIFPPSSGDVAE